MDPTVARTKSGRVSKKRKSLTPISARRLLGLVEDHAKVVGERAHNLCGISRPTFFRWKKGLYKVPLVKALKIAQNLGIEEADFLSRGSVVEALLAERKNTLTHWRLMFEHFSRHANAEGKVDAITGAARILQSKLASAGYSVLLTSHQEGDKCNTRLVATSTTSQAAVVLVLFQEDHDLFCVLESSSGKALVGCSLSEKNVRKLLKVAAGLLTTKAGVADMDALAKTLIADFHG